MLGLYFITSFSGSKNDEHAEDKSKLRKKGGEGGRRGRSNACCSLQGVNMHFYKSD
jgi:hypothetical protein